MTSELTLSHLALIGREILWCEQNPDKAFTAEYRKGFINGLVQARLLITEADKLARESDDTTAPPRRPKIVCLCGSTRFWRTFQQAGLQETLAGNIVLSIGAASGTDDEHFGNLPREEYDRVKTMLDQLHLRKIDMADEVLILNVNGYIGESTQKELNYAIEKEKRVRFWLAVCSYCGDDLAGKDVFIEKNKTFCNEDHFEEWHSAWIEKRQEDAR